MWAEMESDRAHCLGLQPFPARLSAALRTNSRLLKNARWYDLKLMVIQQPHELQALVYFLYLEYSYSSERHLEDLDGFSAHSVFCADFWRMYGERTQEDLAGLTQIG